MAEKFEASPDEDTNKASHFNIELSFKIDYLCTPGREGIIGNYKNKIYYGFYNVVLSDCRMLESLPCLIV